MPVTIHHIGLAVHDADQAAAFYADNYGLGVTSEHVSTADGVRELMLAAGDSYLQLLEPTAPESPVGRFLTRRGPGLHHLALGVPDIRSRTRELQARGVQMIDEEPRGGTGGHLIAFVHPSAAMGTLTELVGEEYLEG